MAKLKLTPTRANPAKFTRQSAATKLPLVTKTLTAGDVLPASETRAACVTRRDKKTGKRAPLKPWHVELAFIPSMGPALRFCTAVGKKGPIVAVRSPEDVKRLARAYKACIARRGSGERARKACALVATKTKSLPLGSVTPRSRR